MRAQVVELALEALRITPFALGVVVVFEYLVEVRQGLLPLHRSCGQDLFYAIKQPALLGGVELAA